MKTVRFKKKDGKDGFEIENGVLIGYSGQEKDVVIPDTVVEIGMGAFEQRTDIMSVVIPEGVRKIGERAFSGCKYLQHVSLPGTLTVIDKWAFSECKGLDSVILPESLKVLDTAAFAKCTVLSSIEIPSAVSGVGTGAFVECIALRQVIFHNGLTEIGMMAFLHCPITEAMLPDSLKVIGPGAFANCVLLERVSAPENTQIGNGAFKYCPALADENGFVIVNDILFGYYGPEGGVTVPDNVRRVDIGAFSFRSDITSVVFGSGPLSIQNHAFASCADLRSVSIGSEEVHIGIEAFNGCSRLERVLAPAVPIQTLEKLGAGPAAAAAYLEHRPLYTKGMVPTGYRHYCLRYRKELLPLILSADSVEALSFYIEENQIDGENYEAEFLIPAQKAGAVCCTAALIEWHDALPHTGEGPFDL